MEKTEKKQTLVRCTDANCKTEFTGKSIKDILENSKCGRDGGPLKDSCKTCLKSEGEFLFKVVPIGSIKSDKKDDNKKEEPPKGDSGSKSTDKVE